jgi:cytochrome c biogenesis factor
VRLPATYWVVILFGTLMVLFVSSTIGPTRLRTAVLAAQLAVLGAFIGFAFIMDAPFLGETAVRPTALAKVIQVMESREK